VPLGEEIPLERGHQRGHPPKKPDMPTIPLLVELFRISAVFPPFHERLQIDTDLLHIITTTADELFRGTNIDDLERP